MIDETEFLKREAKTLSKEKLELEATIDDLKRTLKLTEKESQVIILLITIISFYLCIETSDFESQVPLKQILISIYFKFSSI